MEERKQRKERVRGEKNGEVENRRNEAERVMKRERGEWKEGRTDTFSSRE